VKLKSYFSGTVEAAMELAREELGEEALLINARPATPETRMLGAYEVVFGVPPKLEKASSGAMPANTEPADRLAQDVAGLRREIERMAQSLRGARIFNSHPHAGDPELYSRLIENELAAPLAQAVAEGASMESMFEVDATLGRRGTPEGARRIVALVGPPGAGKTTTLVKLAARYGLASAKPAQILSADVYRIAAADQLRTLASILGIGCGVAETPVALAQALEEHRGKDLIFIDTPGLGSGDMEDGADLARMISSHPEIDTHLVLPASMKPSDLERVIDRYEIFQPAKLLFTRMDETGRYGSLVSEAARRSLPISFLTTGQEIPDDLEPAVKARLTELVLGESASAATPRRAGAAA
jgi:flagellar biosynthesis protein FlhF